MLVINPKNAVAFFGLKSNAFISVNPVRKFGRGFKPLPNYLMRLYPALTDGAFFLTG